MRVVQDMHLAHVDEVNNEAEVPSVRMLGGGMLTPTCVVERMHSESLCSGKFCLKLCVSTEILVGWLGLVGFRIICVGFIRVCIKVLVSLKCVFFCFTKILLKCCFIYVVEAEQVGGSLLARLRDRVDDVVDRGPEEECCYMERSAIRK